MQPCVVAGGEKVGDMTTETNVVPFANGTQYDDWCASNCERCKKSDYFNDGPGCDLEESLLLACFADGTITEQTAQRIGITGETQNRYVWPCGEVEWTEEWKAECHKRHSN